MSPATYDLLTVLLAHHRVELQNGRTVNTPIYGAEHSVIAEYSRLIAVAEAAQDDLQQHMPQSVAA